MAVSVMLISGRACHQRRRQQTRPPDEKQLSQSDEKLVGVDVEVRLVREVSALPTVFPALPSLILLENVRRADAVYKYTDPPR